jgi:hypothetical protein
VSRAAPVILGPFVGGMNSASDPSTVADSELVDIVNLELDLDGSLVQRPPFLEDKTQAQDHLTAIGHALIGSAKYVIFSATTGGTYAYDGTTITTISATLQSKVALQYRDKVYIVATEASPVAGGYWSSGGGFVSQPTMPRGEAAIFSKARMFIVPGRAATVNTSRLQFCDPIVADVFVWTGTNIIDVNPGDGQNLIDIILYNDNLMLFKRDSTYVLAYDLQISDAVLRNVNPNIGATTRYCVATYENSAFALHDGKVYQIDNYDYSHVNMKVPFVVDASTPAGSTRSDEVFLCVVGDRLIVRYFNRVYVYGLKTKTWSRWESKNSILHNFGPLVMLPVTVTQGTTPVYYGGSSLNNSKSILAFVDGYNNAFKEQVLTSVLVNIESWILTKNYDLADTHHFKKLMWWGADLLTNQDVKAYANPIVNEFQVTWGDLLTKTWYSISGATWASPLSDPITVETDIDINTIAFRKFLKFRKALRFRQINFKIVLTGDGSPDTGPCRIFSLTALIAAKQTVVKQVS